MPKSRPIKAPKLSAQERDWQAVQNAPTDYAHSVLKNAYYKRWSARPVVKASVKRLRVDAATYDRMHSQVEEAISYQPLNAQMATAALAAIGITRPKS